MGGAETTTSKVRLKDRDMTFKKKVLFAAFLLLQLFP